MLCISCVASNLAGRVMIFPDICFSLNVINRKSLSVTYITCSGIPTSNLEIFEICIMWFSSLFDLCGISVGLGFAGMGSVGLCCVGWIVLGCVGAGWVVFCWAGFC